MLLSLSKKLEYRAFHQGNLEHAKLLFHRRMTHWYLLRHLENTQFGDKRLNQNDTGNVAETILGLYAIGWHREAEEYCRNIWLNFDGGFGRGGGGPRASELVFWFANYFIRRNADIFVQIKAGAARERLVRGCKARIDRLHRYPRCEAERHPGFRGQARRS